MRANTAEARRHRQRAEARRAILDATEVLMVENGGDDFSIRTLAERCGYTPPTIYHYFGDKQGLVDTLLEERFERLLAGVRRVELGPDPVANVREMALTWLRFGMQNPAFYRLIVTTSSNGEDRTPPSAQAALERMQQPLSELAAAGRLATPREAADQALWALTHGLAALHIARPEHPWAKDLAATAIDAMLRGLVRSDAQGGPGG